MSQTTMGISDIRIFVPEQEIKLDTILKQRTREDSQWEFRLTRAIRITGQKSLRFPQTWEDTTTMAAQACIHLLQHLDPHQRENIRFLTIGTETSVDMSKPVSSYVIGLMEKAGMPLPSSLTTFQVQHACASGTLSLLSVCGLLNSTGKTGDLGIILTSDISRYEAPSTAEITQGAGAVAILVEENPRLLELDLAALGLYSRDVDDFFRPLGSITARVKGGYSVKCYIDSFLGAFEDHCSRMDVDPVLELKSIDVFALHVPYSHMPLNALYKLFRKYLEFDQCRTEDYLREKGFFDSILPATTIGNIYTGSLFLGLVFSLRERLRVMGNNLVGKKVLLSSYGSGNTMALFTGRVAEQAPQVISNWDLDSLMDSARPADFKSYEHWINNGNPGPRFSQKELLHKIPQGRFYLETIREDGYREYNIR